MSILSGNNPFYSILEQVRSVDEKVEMADANEVRKMLKKMKKGDEVTYYDVQTSKNETGKFHGLKNMGGQSYVHVEVEKRGGVMVPLFAVRTPGMK